jgi:acyl-CoA thioesterase FadM
VNRDTSGGRIFPIARAVSSRWQDYDAYGHVNNVVYYSWFDTAMLARPAVMPRDHA